MGSSSMVDDSLDFDDSPTYAHYERKTTKPNEPTDISLRLVGKSPLWGHLLWNAGRVTAEYIDLRHNHLEGKTVLELGAAAALPSLLASLSAKNVVATDYPDNDLIENIQHNIDWLKTQMLRTLPISCQGYIWGTDASELLQSPGQDGKKFDLVIMSDLLFNTKQHSELIATCKQCLADDGIVLVVFTPHRPHKYQQDLEFFEVAQKEGFDVTKLAEKRLAPMFKDDPGCSELRSTVFAFTLAWQGKNPTWMDL